MYRNYANNFTKACYQQKNKICMYTSIHAGKTSDKNITYSVPPNKNHIQLFIQKN